MTRFRRSPSGRHRTIAAYVYNYWTKEEAVHIDSFLTSLMQDLRQLSFEVGHLGPKLPYLTIFDPQGKNVISIYREKPEHRIVHYSLYVAEMEEPLLMENLGELLSAMSTVVRSLLEFDKVRPLADAGSLNEHSFVCCRFIGGEPP